MVAYKEFAAVDGESLTLVECADVPSLLAWRHHPEHVQAQQAARRDYFAEHRIQVCTPLRAYAFDPVAGRHEIA